MSANFGQSGRIISGDPRARDHFGSGDITDAMDVLTVEDFRAMRRRRWRGRFF